ncbi:uncharacterized protein LOC115222915 [Octopus sinensis]|uniref:Uncharacterized protein LOC115222915 n=1 Tax=Octopus sinensis TaxID=2607531 RepID=A0A6P7TH81_9MOLL|nr:uncharacterized protein LOC115222915 [Octopus sinensis]
MITSGCRHTLISGLILLLLGPDCISSLKCYECDNELTNNFCMSDLNLHECGPALDTCQTIVAYSDVSEKLSIIKTCSVNASCHIQKQENKDIPCDKNQNKWICTSCCHEDGCNISGQQFVQSSFSVLQLLIVSLFATVVVVG